MKVKFLGTPDFVAPVRQALEKHHTLVEDINEADLLVVAAYGQILPAEIINKPKFEALNIHPSLLPKYRGSSPIQATLLAGDKKTGVTIIKMDSQMDHGPIIAQETYSIEPSDTFDSLSKKLFQIGADILIRVIPEYTVGKLKLVKQKHDQASFCKIIKKEDGYFDINQPPNPEQLDRMIRAYYPWPGAWTKWNNKVVKFLPEGMIQMEGKKATTLKDFLNGYPSFPIKSF